MNKPVINNYVSGLPILGLATLMLVYLKLTGQIDWSWFWVTLPSFIFLYFGIIAISFCLIALVFLKGLGKVLDRFK